MLYQAVKPSLTVVVPVYNEAAGIREFHKRLCRVMDLLGTWEVIYVNDGSRDNTLTVLRGLEGAHGVRIVNLARNFGKEIALTAGLDYSRGDAVVVIDADLQDPPELISTLVTEWRAGFDVVYARRRTRAGETWVKLVTANLFYRMMGRIGRVRIPSNTGDYRLMSRRVVEAVTSMREHHRFMKGLFAWVGYPSKEVLYDRDARHAGETKWNYWRLWNFALEGVTSFTVLPLQMATYFGLFVSLLALLYGSYIAFDTMLHGNPVAGYPSLVVILLFLGGFQLMTLGVLGEYLGRVFNETKNRPLYFVESATEPAGQPEDDNRPDDGYAITRAETS